jgi:hypothetical protein
MFDCIKREIKPTASQAECLSRCFGHSRRHWNYLVDCGKNKVKAKTYAELKQEGFDWLSEIPAQALANAFPIANFGNWYRIKCTRHFFERAALYGDNRHERN